LCVAKLLPCPDLPYKHTIAAFTSKFLERGGWSTRRSFAITHGRITLTRYENGELYFICQRVTTTVT
jgi:hypothetical protein